jgi:PAS domain S-box-containing protein
LRRGARASARSPSNTLPDAIVTATVTNRRDQARADFAQRGPGTLGVVAKVLLVGIICSLSTQIGFAHKFPPHYISALWPTTAILFSVLVVSPIRHWWAYILAAYFTSVINDLHAGFPVAARLYLAAGVIEVLIAAVSVRRFAHGLAAFDNLRNLAGYFAGAVIAAPFLAAFIAAFAGGAESYWFYWRVWFFSEALAYLMLAPAILTWIGATRASKETNSPIRPAEACVVVGGLLTVSLGVFTWPNAGQANLPVLVYLPLPFLLWAAVRFGPLGANTGLLMVAVLSISGAVRGYGPFAASSPIETVLPLQLFLITLSLPLMCLAALIAERRARTNALRESEVRFRTMADTAPVFIWMAGTDKLCTFLNKSWLDFTGRTLDQELGNGWAQGIHPDDRDRCLADYADAFDARRPFALEYRLRRHDGEYRWVADRGTSRWGPEGTFVGYIGCAEDITPRKDAELTAERHRAELAHVARLSTMGELAASLAHELNQPLAAILGNAEVAERMLRRENVDLTELRAICRDIVSEDHRATEVIRRMRSLVGKEPPALAPLDIGSVIFEVVRLTHSDAVLRQSRVAVDVAPDLPPVLGDRIELQQVVLNLLVNALDAMNDCPTPERVVSVRAARDGRDTVQVAVRDRGTGVSTGDLERIFEPFHTTKRHGLGIGLSISRTIIAAHGGRLWAENNPDRGATFSFTVPVGESKPQGR